MKRTAVWILILAFVGSASQAQDDWPQNLVHVENLVKSVVGDISYEDVEVRRRGRATEVSIGLQNLPHVRQEAFRPGDPETVFLATNFVQPFLDGPEVAEFSLMPTNAHLIDHFFGFWAFNIGKKVRLPVAITVIGEEGQGEEIHKSKKKFKFKKNTLTVRFVEGRVNGSGLYALHTVVGPHSLTTYFCNNC